MASMGHPVRKRSAKPSRTAAFGLPIGMPLTLPSGFGGAHRSHSSTRPSPVNSGLLEDRAQTFGQLTAAVRRSRMTGFWTRRSRINDVVPQQVVKQFHQQPRGHNAAGHPRYVVGGA